MAQWEWGWRWWAELILAGLSFNSRRFSNNWAGTGGSLAQRLLEGTKAEQTINQSRLCVVAAPARECLLLGHERKTSGFFFIVVILVLFVFNVGAAATQQLSNVSKTQFIFFLSQMHSLSSSKRGTSGTSYYLYHLILRFPQNELVESLEWQQPNSCSPLVLL